jgi:hypothetical protein
VANLRIKGLMSMPRDASRGGPMGSNGVQWGHVGECCECSARLSIRFLLVAKLYCSQDVCTLQLQGKSARQLLQGSSVTVTVSGAALGDVVSIGAPNSIPSGVVYFGYVSATNTVTLRMHNGSGGSVDPSEDTFRVYVWK